MSIRNNRCVDVTGWIVVVCVVLCERYVCCYDSVCMKTNFRQLPLNLQGEHMCQLFEIIKDDVTNTRTDAEYLYTQLVMKMNVLESKLDTMKVSRQKPNEQSYSSAARRLPSNVVSFQANRDIPISEDCGSLYQMGVHQSGVYPLRVAGGTYVVMVYCDMRSGGGGWTVIQRRIDGALNFTRNWEEYAAGFGNPNREYWLGNRLLNGLTQRKNYTLRIEMKDWQNRTGFAQYDLFKVGDEGNSFELNIGGYHGNAGDSMTNYHNNMKFSTTDSDNDLWEGDCAAKDGAGWWYRACGYTQLNGKYLKKGAISLTPDGLIHRGVLWYHWKKTFLYSLRHVQMKIRAKRGF